MVVDIVKESAFQKFKNSYSIGFLSRFKFVLVAVAVLACNDFVIFVKYMHFTNCFCQQYSKTEKAHK